MPKPNGGVLGNVAGFGPVGTRLLVAKLEGGHLGEVAEFGPVGSRLFASRPN